MKADRKIIEGLRELFLKEKFGGEAYWRSFEELEAYDQSLARRIAWKWQAVLEELQQRHWLPSSRLLVDFGCGSGVASETVLNFFGADRFDEIVLMDHSKLALDYASAKLQRLFPSLRIRSADRIPPGSTLLISHVLNELPAQALDALMQDIQSASALIWVEPGNAASGRALPRLREELRKNFQVIAPCTHQNRCGLLSPENDRHWCHHFATPPAEVFHDSEWVLMAKEIGIDLRSLPYSFLVLDRSAKQEADEGLSRIIGEPRHYKGYSKILGCNGQLGVKELILQKRDAPELLKSIKKAQNLPLYRWELSGDKIVSGEK